MDFNPAKPRYELTIAGKSYELEGTFALIEAAEYALKENIISIAMRCIEMPVSDMTKLLHSILKSCGHDEMSKADIGEILWNELGVSSSEYAMLCLHIHAFLRICNSKPSEREAVKKTMGEILGEASHPSPGATTSSSASVS
jgi:hypothetical protein